MKKIILITILTLFTFNANANDTRLHWFKVNYPTEFKCSLDSWKSLGLPDSSILMMMEEDAKAFKEIFSGLSKGTYSRSSYNQWADITPCSYSAILMMMKEDKKASSLLN